MCCSCVFFQQKTEDEWRSSDWSSDVCSSDRIAQQGLGGQSGHGSGMGDDTITSGLEGPWTPTPITWSMNYFRMLLEYEYELVKSPADAWQWRPRDQKPEDMAPGAHSPDRRVPTMMTTADLALQNEPHAREISQRFKRNPQPFADAF